ncbi:SHOCT domain-containing protein [Alicyclobacillus curvatus]|nr:SHOCT domain-containing protein [Alicyclobacillus curvatus]
MAKVKERTDMMYGFGGFGGWIPMLLWLVILVSVVYLVIYIVDRAGHRSSSSKSSAEDTLRERYARGEIDTETFLEMKKHLKDK